MTISYSLPPLALRPRPKFSANIANIDEPAGGQPTPQPEPLQGQRLQKSSVKAISPHLEAFEKEHDLNGILAGFDFSSIILPAPTEAPSLVVKMKKKAKPPVAKPTVAGPPVAWRPVMSAKQAEEWAKDSVVQKELVHYTGWFRAFWIRQFGMNLNKFKNGSGAGVGLYFTEPHITAKEVGASHQGGQVRVRVNVKNPAYIKNSYPVSAYLVSNVVDKVWDFGKRHRISDESCTLLLREIERQLYLRAGYDAIIASHTQIGTVILDPQNVVVVK